MDNWYKPSRTCYTQPPPVRQCHRNPKIISIPVQFVGSETTRSASALKIQKVLRGFLVRKSVNKILDIDRQVEEMERAILKKKSMDAKERLRVNEELMNLLFKLDSIHGVYPGIREYRKAVTKKVVAMQEKVDRFASVPPLEEVDTDNSVLVCMDDSNDVDCIISGAVEEVDMDDSNLVNQSSYAKPSCEGAAADDVDCIISSSAVEEDDSNLVDCQGKQSYACFGKPNSVNCEEAAADDVKEIVEDGSVNECCGEEKYIVREEQYSGEHCIKEGKEEQVRCCKEIMNKMIGENEKMMKLMSKICERNEIQTYMLASLMQRVERLEKAFSCTKKNNKKKKTNHTAS